MPTARPDMTWHVTQASAENLCPTMSTAGALRQAIDAGLVDEIRVNLAPWLLGGGIRFFDNLAAAPVKLEQTRAIQGDAVTHLYYRVLPRL